MAALVQTFGLNVSPALKSCSQIAAKFKSSNIEKQLHTVVRKYGEGLTVQASREVFAATRTATPDLTGDLRASIAITPVVPNGDEYQVTMEAPLPYASFPATGTRAHIIRPKRRGGVLVFTGNHGTVFAKSVNHPGTKAKPDFWNDRILRQRWHDGLRSGRIGGL